MKVSKHSDRTMRTNLEAQLKWLKDNSQDAKEKGFIYAPKRATRVKLPSDLSGYSFDFTTPQFAQSRSASIESLSENAMMDVETFRLHESPAKGANNAIPSEHRSPLYEMKGKTSYFPSSSSSSSSSSAVSLVETRSYPEAYGQQQQQQQPVQYSQHQSHHKVQPWQEKTASHSYVIRSSEPVDLTSTGNDDEEAWLNFDVDAAIQEGKQRQQQQQQQQQQHYHQPAPAPPSDPFSSHAQSSHPSGMINDWNDMPHEAAMRANSSYTAPSSGYQLPTEGLTDYSHSGMGADFSDENVPNCNCRMPCVRLVSKKDNSLGKVFFKCPNSKGVNGEGGGCDFFEWEDKEFSRNRDYGEGHRGGGTGTDLGALNFEEEAQKVFGHRSFRPGQRGCIEAALDGRDVFCLMPTGGGKSLVFQLPGHCCPGIAVVFCPLVSLITNQVDALNDKGICARFMSGSQAGAAEYRMALGDVFRLRGDRATEPKLLYVTPEMFSASEGLRNAFKALVGRGLLSRFVIDEAHCISQWGHDFRKDYMSLRKLRQEFPTVPIMALTGTAKEDVVKDTISCLGMRNEFVHTQSFNRHNIWYELYEKKGKRTDLAKQIAEVIKDRFQKRSGLVYCATKRETEELAAELRKHLPFMRDKISFYHAGLDEYEKNVRQRRWQSNALLLLCATVAFGMGIDKPDVRYVIHSSEPKSMTCYYQESGRAGRDGGKSHSIVFYGGTDHQTNLRMVSHSLDSNYNGQEICKRATTDMAQCHEFCVDNVRCRRSMILAYFGEVFDRKGCRGTCDNCCRTGGYFVEDIDASEDAKSIVDAIFQVEGKNLPPMSTSRLIKIMAGSAAKDVAVYKGKLALQKNIKDKYECERIITRCICAGILDEEVERLGENCVRGNLRTSRRALEFMNSGFSLSLAHVGSVQHDATVGPSSGNAESQGLESQAMIDASTASSRGNSKQKATGKAKTSAKDRPAPSRPAPGVGRKLVTESFDDISEFADDDDFEQLSSQPGQRRAGGMRVMQLGRHKKQQHATQSLTEFNYHEDKADTFTTESCDSRIGAEKAKLLHEWLLSYRHKLGQSYYNILNEDNCIAIAKAPPQTFEELSNFPGIGDVRANKYGEEIFATLWAFMQAHDLLTHFDKLQEPTIEKCPSWQDPLSTEAAEVRRRLEEERDRKASRLIGRPASFPSPGPGADAGPGHVSSMGAAMGGPCNPSTIYQGGGTAPQSSATKRPLDMVDVAGSSPPAMSQQWQTRAPDHPQRMTHPFHEHGLLLPPPPPPAAPSSSAYFPAADQPVNAPPVKQMRNGYGHHGSPGHPYPPY